jgi:hypothetical protein
MARPLQCQPSQRLAVKADLAMPELGPHQFDMVPQAGRRKRAPAQNNVQHGRPVPAGFWLGRGLSCDGWLIRSPCRLRAAG